LSPNYGGPVSVVKELVHAQQLVGHELVIATTQTDHPHGVYHKPGWDFLADNNVRVYYGALHFAPLRVSLDLASYLRRTMKDFDIIHVHGLYRFPSTYAAYQCRKQGIPYIICPHGSLDPYLYHKSARSLWLKRLHERWFDLPNLQGASAIHYTAEDERERVKFLKLRSPSFVVPNGINWNLYELLPTRGMLRARWGVGDSPIVLFLGRLHFKKGLDLLITAFDEVRKQTSNSQLVIIGPENDDYGQKVRGWVNECGMQNSVHFVGSLHGAEVIQAYVDADVFALPSYTENFGMTVAEAMACGLPVVISDQVNIHADVAKAGAGLVTRCDAHEVASALSTLLGEPDKRRVMGQAGRELVQERYNWSVIVEKLTREYENIIERHVNVSGKKSTKPGTDRNKGNSLF
jgi:glycosyltransferase involved in cell wall biosynthesis